MDRRRKLLCRAYFTGCTNANPVESERQLLGFLTMQANDVVGAIHPKAMPVILTTPAEIESWMTGRRPRTR
jgi:putative SOS response-associated peptidase YedK